MTREEAIKELWSMYPESLATEKGYYHVEKLIHTIFDKLEAMAQPKTCRTCLTQKGCTIYDYAGTNPDTFSCCYYEPKDQQ